MKQKEKSRQVSEKNGQEKEVSGVQRHMEEVESEDEMAIAAERVLEHWDSFPGEAGENSQAFPEGGLSQYLEDESEQSGQDSEGTEASSNEDRTSSGEETQEGMPPLEEIREATRKCTRKKTVRKMFKYNKLGGQPVWGEVQGEI